MHAGFAWLIVAQLATPPEPEPELEPEPPQWGVNGWTTVRGVDALTDYIVIWVSEWCRYADEPEVWMVEEHEFLDDDEPLTVQNNPYQCRYEIIKEGEKFTGAPWDAPKARDDVFFALPRSRLVVEDGLIPELEEMPVTEFYPRLESGWGGALRAATGPTRGIPVPFDALVDEFVDEVRAEIRDGVFALIPERRTWKFAGGEEVVTAPGAGPPVKPSEVVPEPAPEPSGEPEPASASPGEPPSGPAPPPAPTQPSEGERPGAEDIPGPLLPPADVPEETAPAAAPAANQLARDLGVGGGCLVLGFLVGFALRRYH
jgi:hypothetical protein